LLFQPLGQAPVRLGVGAGEVGGASGLRGVSRFWRQRNLARNDAQSLTSHRPVAEPVGMETQPSPLTADMRGSDSVEHEAE